MLGLAINVALSVIPCPVGGAAIDCQRSKVLFVIGGVIETNLFSKVFTWEEGSLFPWKLNDGFTKPVKAFKEIETRFGHTEILLPAVVEVRLVKDGKEIDKRELLFVIFKFPAVANTGKESEVRFGQ